MAIGAGGADPDHAIALHHRFASVDVAVGGSHLAIDQLGRDGARAHGLGGDAATEIAFVRGIEPGAVGLDQGDLVGQL